MKMLRTLTAASLVLCIVSAFASGPNNRPRPLMSKAAVATQTRSLARKLATAWVETAAPGTLDQLAQRSIAFAGMVSGRYVFLDSTRMPATQVLTDSALTILNKNAFEADAGAIRNIVYALTEIAEGRASMNRR
jgi:hypothetical protein